MTIFSIELSDNKQYFNHQNDILAYVLGSIIRFSDCYQHSSF